MRSVRYIGVVLIFAIAVTGCATGTPAQSNPVLDGSGEVAAGEELFASNCAQCHGADANGSSQGPSFLNDIYIPSHHADGAFLLAVRNGAQQHHWNFGPMPPRPGLSDQDIADIVAWVRDQQRSAGVIE